MSETFFTVNIFCSFQSRGATFGEFLTPKINSKHRVSFQFFHKGPHLRNLLGGNSKDTRCFELILGVRNAPFSNVRVIFDLKYLLLILVARGNSTNVRIIFYRYIFCQFLFAKLNSRKFMIIYYLIQFLSIFSWKSNSAKVGVVFLPFLIVSQRHSLPTAITKYTQKRFLIP